jgi:hypothetical protein
MGLEDLMDAVGNLSNDLGEADRFRLLCHGQPSQFVPPPCRGLVDFPN